uniref:Mitochondrial inner membrane protease subunit 2 n=1 Tax=Ciona intestinalis TaxID=7719 RepID=F6WS92_CIOIN|nr:mitochondrial inner membrane protease subunit 2-like [Ciona intestinalis]|eukprot:XP_026691304.1 mitochondrial inner membrane protease subunit 2-like [Ciona intestinalis]
MFNFHWNTFLHLTRKIHIHIGRRCQSTRSNETISNSASWSTMLMTAGFTCCFVSILDDKVVTYTMVSGSSMQPCLNPIGSKCNDRVLIDRSPKRNFKKLKRGELVIYRTTRNPDEVNIKRLVALEGDTVTTLGYKNRSVLVPTGHCWVEGDNHRFSDDSNVVGPVPLGLISGRATHIIYPPSRWESICRRFPHSRVKLNPCEEDTVSHLPDVICGIS